MQAEAANGTPNTTSLNSQSTFSVIGNVQHPSRVSAETYRPPLQDIFPVCFL